MNTFVEGARFFMLRILMLLILILLLVYCWYLYATSFTDWHTTHAPVIATLYDGVGFAFWSVLKAVLLSVLMMPYDFFFHVRASPCAEMCLSSHAVGGIAFLRAPPMTACLKPCGVRCILGWQLSLPPPNPVLTGMLRIVLLMLPYLR